MGETTVSVNIQSYSLSEEKMEGVRVYEMNSRNQLQTIYVAKYARFSPQGWNLFEVSKTEFSYTLDAEGKIREFDTKQSDLATQFWPNTISPDMVAAAVMRPERMNTSQLFSYTQHLENNAQSTQLYEIAFWRKVFYPLSTIVMVVLALPFAYLHFRTGNIASYVFIGVLIGISFFLLNNIFGYIGYLKQWTPWLASAAPSMLYSLLALVAFGWLVLRR
jgi:lipopolysaccharide export system permease protein